MRIIVTGSSGKIGREAVAALKAAGHRVTGVDLKPSPGGTRTINVDCTDFGQVMGALSGTDTVGGIPDAIVHLAGIPMPGLTPDNVVFEANTVSTYNIFSAAARLGIRRIAWGSSETVLGLPFDEPPAYLPLDEDAPSLPNWSYSLSKHLGETMADQFVRWHKDMTIVSLRFSNVYAAEDYAAIPSIHAKPASRKLNLWGYVDARDAGQACRCAVEADLAGHQRFIIAAADSVSDRPSADLAAEYWPGVPVRELPAYASFIASQRAVDLIGYVPAHSWRDRI